MALLGSLFIGAGIGWLAVTLYNLLFTSEERKIIESRFKTHHFEYGIATTLVGLLLKSPKAVGTGLYWLLDDLDDADEAIKNLKRKWKSFCDKVNQFQTQLSFRSTINLQPRINQGYNYRFSPTDQNFSLNISTEIEKLKNWLRNKKIIF